MVVCRFFALFLLIGGALSAAEGKPAPAVTAEQIAALNYDDCQDDGGHVAPLTPVEKLNGEAKKEFEALLEKVKKWEPAGEKDVYQRVRNFINLISMVDVSRAQFEGELASHILSALQKEVAKEELMQACARIAVHPELGKTINTAPDLGYDWLIDEEMVRQRSVIYAKKLLGRLNGKITPVPSKHK